MDINITIRFEDPACDGRKLDEILNLLKAIKAEDEIMANTFADVLTGIAAETTVEASVEALLTQITSLLASNGVPQAQIDQAVSQLQANTAALSAALTANTPAAPATPAPAAAALAKATP